MENLTGEQSATRRAQEALRGTIKKLSSWEDFHNTLAFHGMKYQKKGSGAVIVVGDVTVKASSVSKNLTLSKLEKQLGPFQEIQHLAQIMTSQPLWRSVRFFVISIQGAATRFELFSYPCPI